MLTIRPASQRGLSLVETMVGIAVGLFLVGGAIKLFIDNLDSNRRLLMETRVNQDLRAAADLIARDLRRAGHWANAASGVWQADGVAPAASNPHAAPVASANQITYTFDDAAGVSVNGGFRLTGGRLQTFATGAWQDLTDPATMNVTQFDITPVTRVVNLLSRCPGAPTSCGATPGCPPTLTVRQYAIELRARSNADATIVRELRETVRVRNDVLQPPLPFDACPSP